MPVLSTDAITFHLEFYNLDGAAAAPSSGLFRDGMECSMSKSSTSSNWNVSAKDLYVRTSADTLAEEDFNNAVALDGQDWFVYETDAESDSSLCTTKGSGVYQCSKIKCKLRRRMTTSDADDFSFVPTSSSVAYMTFPAGKSYIEMN